MNIWSVICEYNPFHNGHQYLLSEMKKSGAEAIVSCMSGNVVQRGDFALYDKYVRTRTALLNGADLVIELPVTYACAGAEKFAYGGTFLLEATGCIDTLCFGSECGDMERLKQACQASTAPEFADRVKHYLSLGQPFAKARENAVADSDKTLAEVLRSPNNILGIEYLKALPSAIKPLTWKRIGSAHDSMTPCGEIASATMIRERLVRGADCRAYLPEPITAEMHLLSQVETAVLYRLRMMEVSGFARLPDIS